VRTWDPDERIASIIPGPTDTQGALIAKLGADARGVTSEPNVLLEPAESRQRSFAFDDGFGSLASTAAQPALASLHVLQAQAVSQGQGVKVAILDTGADPNHPVIAGRIVGAWDFVAGRSGADEVALGVDTNGDGVADGAFGHGTHVAGIVLLTAPNAQLLVGRVLDSDGVGDVSTVAAGIRWAVQSGARIINLSLGSLARSSAIANAIDEAEQRGVLVFAAAGNWGAEFPQEYPARLEEVSAVAATDAAGTPATWSSFASYVAISAPGVAIRSAFPGGGYRLWSGTSMSTPFVAGTAALLLARHPGWSGEDVARRLAATAAPLANVPPAEVGKLGSGMLDVGAALAPDASAAADNIIVQGPGYIPVVPH
jgi:subtilisin family serine protease